MRARNDQDEARFTHVDERGAMRMVDVGEKPPTERRAVAEAWVRMRPETLARLRAGDTPKGDVLAAARLGGIMGAKRTADLIPLCHPLPLAHATVDLTPRDEGVHVRAEVRTVGRTGVEMEALTAVSIACLTLYDMLKAVDRGMTIGPIELLEKSGGRSGTYRRAG